MHAPQKKSSMGRDVAIGIAIAAVVLGAFLVVKFAILDKGGGEKGPPPSVATIEMAFPTGASAQLFIDDKLIKTVSNGEKVDVAAGKRRIKLLGAADSQCEASLELPGGKVTPLQCELKVQATAPSTGSGSATATTPVETVPTNPATTTTTTTTTPEVATAGSGSGSAATSEDTKPDDKMPPEVKAVPTTTPTTTTKTPDAATTTKTPDPKTVVKTPDPKTVVKTPDPKTVVKTPAPKTVVKTPDPKTVVKTPDPKTAATKAPSDKGFLDVFSKPSARIHVDGVDTGLSTPVTGGKLKLTPGKHKIGFVIGGDKFTYSVNIKAGATEVLSKDLPVQ